MAVWITARSSSNSFTTFVDGSSSKAGSGSGKSVCLKHMVGLMRPGSGSVRVLGEELTELNEHQLVPVRTAVSMIFHVRGPIEAVCG